MGLFAVLGFAGAGSVEQHFFPCRQFNSRIAVCAVKINNNYTPEH